VAPNLDTFQLEGNKKKESRKNKTKPQETNKSMNEFVKETRQDNKEKGYEIVRFDNSTSCGEDQCKSEISCGIGQNIRSV
jgi:hypothetical protein